MKTINQGSRIPPVWIGQVITCHQCGFQGTLEAGDPVYRDSVKPKTGAPFQLYYCCTCPTCATRLPVIPVPAGIQAAAPATHPATTNSTLNPS